MSELPLGEWTSSYKAWLQKMMADDKASWVGFAERHTERRVCFAFQHTPAQLRELNAKGAPPLYKTFQLEQVRLPTYPPPPPYPPPPTLLLPV